MMPMKRLLAIPYTLILLAAFGCAEPRQSPMEAIDRSVVTDRMRDALHRLGHEGPAVVSVITLRNGGVVVRAAPGDVGNRGSEPDPAGDPEGSSISLFHDDTSCPGDHATEDLDYITLPARHPAQVENFHRDGRVEETHIFFAFNSSTGRFEQVLDVEVVELNADPIFCTGGHTHAVEDKPVTRYEPNHGITSADGTFETTANPPNAAGDEIQHIVWVPREGPSQGDTITSRSLHANRVTPERDEPHLRRDQ